MVLVSIPHERISGQSVVKSRVKVVQTDYLRLNREELIREPVPGKRARVAKGRGNHVPGVLRSVLIGKGCTDFGPGNIRSSEQGIRQSQGLWKTDASGNTEFIGVDPPVAGLELEITKEAQVQPLTAMEYVLMEITELRRHSHKAVGVG